MANASVPAPDGTINGCYKTSDIGQGSLYVIDSDSTCPAGYTSINWNQPVGLRGYQVYRGSVTTVGPHSAGSIDGTITCPSGKVALGAGSNSSVTESVPTSDGTGWVFTYPIPSLDSGSDYVFSASITCATSEG